MIRGKESIIFIKFRGVWTPISCESSNSFTEDAQMLETTTRDNKGWATSIPTMQSYSLSISAETMLESNSEILSYYNLVELKRNKTLVEWRREVADGAYIDSGKAYITNIGDSAEADGFVNFNLTLQGFGKPEYISDALTKFALIAPNGTKYIITADEVGRAVTSETNLDAKPYYVVKSGIAGYQLRVNNDGRIVTNSTTEATENIEINYNNIIYKVTASNDGRVITTQI